jgi:hypothetical protein
MRMHVDPSANALFASVGVTVGAAGAVEHAPATEQEWLTLRVHALTLAEAANLLLIPGRPVVEREDPRQHLQRMVWRDPERWNEYVRALAEAAAWTLEAIDARNAIRLHSHGGDISLACERCHLQYRYPDAARLIELRER